jgi:hypothetical protein
MGNSIKNILIIGNGIAAWAVQKELSAISGIKITNYSSEGFFPACSLRTTSINCLRGTERGLSQLGDIICESYADFERFILEQSPDGIFKGHEYQTWETEDKEKWERRYKKFHQVASDPFLQTLISKNSFYVKNDAYFIDPNKLQKWFYKNSKVEYINDTVTSITENNIVYSLKGVRKFDYIINCGGYKAHSIFRGLNKELDYYHEHSKPVAGSYLQIKLNKTTLNFENNFNIVVGGHHFIHRLDQGVLQIGSTSENNSSIYLPRTDLLRDIYSNIKKHIKLDIPDFEAFDISTGIRHKGHKRVPFMKRVCTNKWAMTGLYKNGFSFAFKGAKEISLEINQELTS